MINRYAKGKRLELLAKKKLEKRGYKIAFKSMFVKFQNIDFDGRFDIVAYRNKRWRFIQVKSKMDHQVLEDLQKWEKDSAPFFSLVELWVWNPKKKNFDIYAM